MRLLSSSTAPNTSPMAVSTSRALNISLDLRSSRLCGMGAVLWYVFQQQGCLDYVGLSSCYSCIHSRPSQRAQLVPFPFPVPGSKVGCRLKFDRENLHRAYNASSFLRTVSFVILSDKLFFREVIAQVPSSSSRTAAGTYPSAHKPENVMNSRAAAEAL